MGVGVNNLVLDAPLDYISNNCDEVFLCSAQPTTYTEANTTYPLANKTVTPGDGNGNFLKSSVSTSRVLTISGLTAMTITLTGSATYIALCDSSGSGTLLATWPLPASTALSSSNTATAADVTYTSVLPTVV